MQCRRRRQDAQVEDGRQPCESLFKTPYTETGHHTRRCLEEAMVRFCKAADVPYVCPHALKGTAATLLAQTGELADRIADHLSLVAPLRIELRTFAYESTVDGELIISST